MKEVDLKALFGDAIKSHRDEQQISQEELAARAGLHRTYVSDVERGVRNPSLKIIERLARALKLSVSALFHATGNGSARGGFVEILLVEDDPHDVELTRRAFRKARISNVLNVASDGAEALDFLFATGAHRDRAEKPLPGVIMLDLNLPKVDGLEVLRRIKADRQTREIPVIILTVSERATHIAECRALGVESYIVKPVGFQNFSAVTPHLDLDWVLKRSKDDDERRRERR